MISNKKDIIPFLISQQKTMVDQLHQFCEMNSGSENLLGLAEIHQRLKTAFAPIADQIDSITLPPYPVIDMAGNEIKQSCGDALFIRKRPELNRRILLCGHMDTVYGINHPFQKLTYIDKNIINGPGVADMKGGLIVILHALTCFEQLAQDKSLGWDVLINADEELGSPTSRQIINKIAKNYQAALVYEPAMTSEGTLARNRRGSGKFTLVASGKAAHVGRSFAEGRNAICYLAEALGKIHALNENEQNITINIGKIAGGEAVNMIPDKAVAKMDIRINSPQDELWVRQALENIMLNLQRKDYSLALYGDFYRPVKKVNDATKRLFLRIQKLGESLGLNLNWQDSGGCCDGNNLAQLGLPVMDTLGVRGGNIHSPAEFIIIDSLVERAMLSTLILADLAEGGLEELKS